MQHSILHRVIARLRRNAHLCLPALALALTLGCFGAPPQLPPEANAPIGRPPTHIPLVNWNS